MFDLIYKYIRRGYRKYIPLSWREAILLMRRRYAINQMRLNIIEHLRSISPKDTSIEFLSFHKLNTFPYIFIEKYDERDIVVYSDAHCNMKFVLHEEKKLYFKRGWSAQQVQKYYNSLLIEQDIESPHRYESADFCVEHGDIVVDAGAAEGIFALSIIEKAKKVYLFESDIEWCHALALTFRPYMEKVEIVNRYVSNVDDDFSVTFDTYFKNLPSVDFIKADIEGAELKLLEGSGNILANNVCNKIVICAYHNDNDSTILREKISKYAYRIQYSKGYMLYQLGNVSHDAAFYVRRGLIRGKKLKQKSQEADQG